MHNQKKAFSLPEVLVAILVLASVIIYFLLSFTIGKYAIQLSKERLVVANLLREEMETVLGTNYSALVDGTAQSQIAISDGLKTFSATKTLDIVTVQAGIYGYKEIHANIAWTGGVIRNRTLSEEMVMYVTKK